MDIFFNFYGGVVVPKRILSSVKKTAAAILKSENKSGPFGITFTDEKTIRVLNKKFRKIDKATDVLSFCMDEVDFLGDIVICRPVAEKNAKRYNISFGAEIKRLAIHGLLHLLGYDHAKLMERGKMRIKEAKYLKL